MRLLLRKLIPIRERIPRSMLLCQPDSARCLAVLALVHLFQLGVAAPDDGFRLTPKEHTTFGRSFEVRRRF